MLSIERCRELIKGSEKYTDEQIAKIRNDFYQFADLALDVLEEKNSKTKL